MCLSSGVSYQLRNTTKRYLDKVVLNMNAPWYPVKEAFATFCAVVSQFANLMRWSGTTLGGWLGRKDTPSNLDAAIPDNVSVVVCQSIVLAAHVAVLPWLQLYYPRALGTAVAAGGPSTHTHTHTHVFSLKLKARPRDVRGGFFIGCERL